MAAALPAPAPSPGPAAARRPHLLQLVMVAPALAVVTLIPVAIAAWKTPAGTVFTGYVVIARDAFVYQALWRAGWNGAWLFHPLYSSEPQPGILIYPWYLWTGHLVGFLSGPVLYHAARIAAGVALLFAVWRLASTLYHPRTLRRWALMLAVLGGGIGVLLPDGFALGPLHSVPTENLVSGTSVSDILSMAPHLAWAAALLCWTFAAALRWTGGGSRFELVTGLLAWLGLELIYPQLALLALCTIGAWAILRRNVRALAVAGLGAALLAPYLSYLAWAQSHDPGAFVGIGATQQVPFHFDVGNPFGFLLLSHLTATLLIAVALIARRVRGDLWLPALWVVVMTAFMFAPGLRTVVGRSYLASSVPFGLLAAAGIPVILDRVRHGAWRLRALAAMLTVSSLFGIYSLAHPLWIATFRLDPRAEYESSGEADLLRRIAPHTSWSDVILTTYLDGVFVPAQTNARAFVGHPDQTLQVLQKSDQAVAFFERWDAAQRDAFVRAQGITYVLTTDPQAAARLSSDPQLRRIDAAGQATLFRVSAG